MEDIKQEMELHEIKKANMAKEKKQLEVLIVEL